MNKDNNITKLDYTNNTAEKIKSDNFRGSIRGDNVFENGTNKNLWNTAFKKLKCYGLLKNTIIIA